MANVRATTPPTVQPQPAKSSWFGTLVRVLLMLLTVVIWMAAVFAVGSIYYYQRQHVNRIYDGVSVRGINMSGLTLAEAEERLSVAFDPYPLAPVTVRYGDQSWTLTAADLGVDFDAGSAAEAAYEIGRRAAMGVEAADRVAALQANLQEQLSAYRFGREVLADEAVDRSAGLVWLEARAREINRPVAEATLRVDGLDVVTTPSQTGYALDVSASHAAIYQALLNNSGATVELAVNEETPLLADVSQADVFMRQVLSGPVVLTASEPDLDAQAPPPNYTIPQETLVNLTSLEMTPQLDGSMQLLASLDVEPLRPQVQEWAAELAREPRDARLDYDPETGEISVVTPSQTGRVLDVDATLQAIHQATLSDEHNATLPLALVEPAVNMHKIDEMGIVELVATGTTSFRGSSADRVHNIATAATAVDNTVVAPGAVFSFNDTIGDVNAENGYTDSLIIWGDRTAVGIGGGVCQVSTTAFRAAFLGGFPIEERWNHGYVVSWYGQPGLDATIYTPTVDFKFRNTTGHHIIIKADLNEAKGTLTFNFYGTKPDWDVDVTGPEILKESPPPPPIYQTDASLGAGEVRQVEYAKNGMDVAWRRVIRDSAGEVLSDEVLESSYTPWAAYYLVGPTDDSAAAG